MDAGKLRKRFQSRELVIGTHVRSQDPCISELLAGIGYDVLWIENEHSNLDKYQTTLHIIAAQAAGASAVVRLPWNDPVLVKPILELAPDGVVFPMIKTAEEAQKAVAACRYPPRGVRGMGPIRANNYGLIDNVAYLATADEQIFKIMQIEHVHGVENIDSILEVNGVDAVVVGQFDLAASLGLLPDVENPKNMEMIRRVFSACVAKGVPCGISSPPNADSLEIYLKMGARFLFMCYEYDWIRMGASSALHLLKGLLK